MPTHPFTLTRPQHRFSVANMVATHDIPAPFRSRFGRTTTTLLLVGCLGLQSCANMTPEQKAAFSGLAAGVGVAALGKHAGGMKTNEALLLGAAAGALTAKLVYDYEVRKATQRQIAIAHQRAAAYQNRVKAEEARNRSIALSKTASSSEKKKAKAAISKPKSRYVAVETTREANSTGSSTVSIYDTKNEKLVSNDVYDIKQQTKEGEVAKLGNYTVQYVGD